MPDTRFVAELVVVSAAVTWALRAMPFAALALIRDSHLVRYLSLTRPLGVMLILAAYAVRGVAAASLPQAAAFAAAVTVTAGLHLWRRHPLISIVGGTATYVLLATVLAR